ncbi:hypothetical protein DFH06DRAFT_98891 [Mycena polygramma]|nr:hypothetical protein DFH06DRAFT_98891 [Mycena polygramma]
MGHAKCTLVIPFSAAAYAAARPLPGMRLDDQPIEKMLFEDRRNARGVCISRLQQANLTEKTQIQLASCRYTSIERSAVTRLTRSGWNGSRRQLAVGSC